MTCACGCGEAVKRGRRWARGHNARVHNPMVPVNAERDEEITRRYALGENIAALADEYGLTRGRIRRIAWRLGQPPRPHSMQRRWWKRPAA